MLLALAAACAGGAAPSTGTDHRWSALGVSSSGDVYALAHNGSDVFGSRAFATGSDPRYHVALARDNAMTLVGAAFNGPVVSLVVDGSTLYAGGRFTAVGDVAAANVAAWSDGAWAPLGSGTSGPVYAAWPFDGELFVSGHFTSAGGLPAEGVAAWSPSARSWRIPDTLLSGPPSTSSPSPSGSSSPSVFASPSGSPLPSGSASASARATMPAGASSPSPSVSPSAGVSITTSASATASIEYFLNRAFKDNGVLVSRVEVTTNFWGGALTSDKVSRI